MQYSNTWILKSYEIKCVKCFFLNYFIPDRKGSVHTVQHLTFEQLRGSCPQKFHSREVKIGTATLYFTAKELS